MIDTGHRLIGGRAFAALLFDMDGTLLSSVASANRVWARWAAQAGHDPAHVVSIIHGVRAIDTMRRLGVADPEAEADRLTRMEIEDVDGIVPLPGAAAFVAALPADRWAIVTSAPRALALARLRAAGLAVPSVLVSAEDVAAGKPAPDGYRLAARRLGVDIAACLVLEDAAAGIEAGRAAGAALLVVTATHDTPSVIDDATIADYTTIRPAGDVDGAIRLLGL